MCATGRMLRCPMVSRSSPGFGEVWVILVYEVVFGGIFSELGLELSKVTCVRAFWHCQSILE